MTLVWLMLESQDLLGPEYRIETPAGTYILVYSHRHQRSHKAEMLRRVHLFMREHQAFGFSVVCYAPQLHGIVATWVAYCQGRSLIVTFARKRYPTAPPPLPWTPADFPSYIDAKGFMVDELAALLPRGNHELTQEERTMLARWFGPAGRYPAILQQSPAGAARAKAHYEHVLAAVRQQDEAD